MSTVPGFGTQKPGRLNYFVLVRHIFGIKYYSTSSGTRPVHLLLYYSLRYKFCD